MNIKASMQSELDKPLVFVGVIVIALLVIVQFIVLPWLQWRAETVEYLGNKRNNLPTIDRISAGQQQIDALLLQVKSEQHSATSRMFKLPPKTHQIMFQKQLDKLVDKNQLTVLGISSNDRVLGSGISEVVVELNGNGPLDGIERFLMAVENAENLINVKEFNMQKRFRTKKDSFKFKIALASYSVESGA